jgi:hypothetical protein
VDGVAGYDGERRGARPPPMLNRKVGQRPRMTIARLSLFRFSANPSPVSVQWAIQPRHYTSRGRERAPNLGGARRVRGCVARRRRKNGSHPLIPEGHISGCRGRLAALHVTASDIRRAETALCDESPR